MKARAFLSGFLIVVLAAWAGGWSHAQDALVIDHTCTDLSLIPDYWLEQARTLTIHYAHTSHGSQITSGIDALETEDPSRYAYSIFYAGNDPPTGLDCDPGTLCVFDGNPPETYITPEDYWESSAGIARTDAVAQTGLFGYCCGSTGNIWNGAAAN